MNPWPLLAGLIAAISLVAAGFGFGHHVEYLKLSAYESAQKAAAEKQVADNKTALATQQVVQQQALQQITLNHVQETDELTKRRDALLLANSDLTQRLFVRTASAGSGQSAVPKTGARGPVAADPGYVALPRGLTPWLIGEFTEADSDAALVTALQAVVVEDRKICDGSLPGIPAAQ